MFVKPEKSFTEANSLVNQELYIQRNIKRILSNLDKIFDFVKEAEKIELKYLYSFIRFLYLVKILQRDFIPLDNNYFDNWGSWKGLARYRYGNDIGEWLISEIKEKLYSGKFEYPSNVTFCEIGNKQEEDDFANTRDCCGRVNWIESPFLSSRKFKFGFNYGH